MGRFFQSAYTILSRKLKSEMGIFFLQVFVGEEFSYTIIALVSARRPAAVSIIAFALSVCQHSVSAQCKRLHSVTA